MVWSTTPSAIAFPPLVELLELEDAEAENALSEANAELSSGAKASSDLPQLNNSTIAVKITKNPKFFITSFLVINILLKMPMKG
ncbi:MAG: hypothetical protein AB8G86_30280 [Saprospiraceae bacterium]